MSNTNQNLLDQVLDGAIMTQIMDSLAVIEGALPDSTLTPEQRSSLNAISVNNKVFAEEVLDEMTTNPHAAVTAAYNKDSLANDLAFFEQVETITSRTLDIVQRLNDLKRVAGHEAYGMATGAYAIYETLAKTGAPGAQNSYDRLKVRFAGQGGRPEDGEENAS